jgi:four helix bundle protein
LIEEIRSHKDLNVWKKSIDLVDIIYKVTKSFPKEEIYCLTNQIRRSVISIPSNIAEGAARNSKKEFIQFLYIALGSLSELETQIIIANRQGYLNNLNSLLENIKVIQKLINGLIYSIKKKSQK